MYHFTRAAKDHEGRKKKDHEDIKRLEQENKELKEQVAACPVPRVHSLSHAPRL